jgi:ComF family protein
MQRLLDLLLPPQCPGCGVEDTPLCAACGSTMARRQDEPPGLPIGLAATQPAGFTQLEWCCSYTGPARAALHALKYDGERRLLEPLADLMAQRWRHAAIGGDLIVPVPVHSQRLRERGFDQASLLAREVGRRVRLPVHEALERRADTQAQHRLGQGARAANVSDVFSVRPTATRAVAGRWVVLVDDVVTTGATLAACARALCSGGALAVSGLTLARER